jgi:inward rectifier potassium channel
MSGKPNPQSARQRMHSLSFGERQMWVKGLSSAGLHDMYHLSMTMSWPWFYGAVASFFVLVNLLFASLYALVPGSVANLAAGDFAGAFFFSVETLATVGYGDWHPASTYGHVLATTEIFVGMMIVALTTGLTFARFARPRVRIIASRNPVVNRYHGQMALMIRAANARKSMIVQASANLYVLLAERSPEGHNMRRLLDLKLLRRESPMFLLSWTLIHVIDESSPLWGHDADSLSKLAASLVLTINGHDEVTLQDMRSRHLYSVKDIRWNHRYRDMLSVDESGREFVDYEQLDATEPVAGSGVDGAHFQA